MIRTHYMDASAIVKLVVNEDGSAPLREYVGKQSVFFAFTPCFVEAMSVLKGKRRRGDIGSDDEYHAACEELVALVRHESLSLEGTIETAREQFDEAETLARAHTIDLIDAYQLCVVKRGLLSRFNGTMSTPVLITADKGLATAARANNIRVWRCDVEPAPQDV